MQTIDLNGCDARKLAMLFVIVAAAAGSLGACTRESEVGTDPASMELGAKTWTWVSATQADGTELVPRAAEFTLTFRPDGTFSATTDCNGVQGRYAATSGGRLVLSDLAATMMFCAESQESLFTGLLERTASYTISSSGELLLQLAEDGGVAIFR